MAMNLTTAKTLRQYATVETKDAPPIDPTFVHGDTGQPTPPTYPGTLNSYERAEVQRYLANPTDAVLASLRLPDAIANANLWKTYFADPAYKAWIIKDRLAKWAQWRGAVADAVDQNSATTPPSQDATGAGSSPPGGGILPRSTN